MKNLLKPICVFMLIIAPNFLSAQNDVERVVGDLLFLADEFARPAAAGAAYQASAGWYTSGATLEPWEFEVSAHANALFIPSSRKFGTVSNSQLSLLNIKGASSAKVPTAFGEGSEVFYEGNVFGNSFEFQAFEGIGKGFVAHPFAQVTMGLPYETEVTVRALPELTVDGVNFSTFGGGIKHNFSQYFRFNQADDIQLAGVITYSKFDVNYAFEPVAIPEIAVLDLIDVDANIWLFEALASKRYGEFEVFGALGATNSKFGYQMDGSGPFLGDVNTALEVLGDNKLEFKGDIGFNLYFNKFKVSSMITAGKFFNLNLGLHFRI